jgi:pimeloyl-ACP methyl ester carboxylesterase
MDRYIDVNGVHTWCAFRGADAGEPVLLLHGGFEHGEIWEPQIGALGAAHPLVIPDRRGQGRTPDVEGPITYDDMCADTVALVEALELGAAHVVGFSDGADVAMLLALARPDLVKRLVLIGGNFHHAGVLPELHEMVVDPTMEAMLRSMYDPVSPDGADHFPVVRDKLLRMWREEPTLSTLDLARITAPTLVLAGDDDLIALEHLLDQYRAIPTSQLAIVPGTSHMLLFERPGLVNTMLVEFLDGGEPATMAPVRRRPA